MTKNITLSAEQKLIALAREKAKRENSSLNQRFREWLERYINGEKIEEKYKVLKEELNYAKAGKKFTREELNER